jgi:hypothetical protein
VLWTLAFGAAVSALAAAAFAYAGARFVSRGLGAERRASRAFAAWWLGIAAYAVLQAAQDAMGAAGSTPLPLFAALRYATLALICIAFAGLAHYVLYVRRGDDRLTPWVWVYYGLLAGAFVAIVRAAGITGVMVQRWKADVAVGPAVDARLFAVSLLLAIVPVVLATAAYLRLRALTDDARQRRRILVVGCGILLALVAMAVSRATNDDAFQLVARPILGAGVALLIAREFRDPRPPNLEARDALHQRVRELV